MKCWQKLFVGLKCAAAMAVLMADAVLSFALADFTHAESVATEAESKPGTPAASAWPICGRRRERGG
jgi:hypothetical protein